VSGVKILFIQYELPPTTPSQVAVENQDQTNDDQEAVQPLLNRFVRLQRR
jgi:hypothetical protein